MITIITPVYKEAKALNKFLTALTKQTSQNYIVSLAIDTNIDGVLEVIEKFKDLRKKMTIIYNSKRTGKAASIKQAILKLETEYAIVASTSIIIGNTFVEHLNELIKKGGSDIIEFNAKLKNPFKMKGKVRKIVNKKVKIADVPSVLAYSYPVEFNKIVRSKVLKKANKLKMSTVINSMFDAEYIYKTLLSAETYSSFNEDVLTKSRTQDISRINLVQIIDQWEFINKYVTYNFGDDFKHEIEYAHFHHVNVFISHLAYKMDSKVLKKKVQTKLNELNQTTFKDFHSTNKYLLSDNAEAKVLIKNKDIDKHHRNLKDVQAWI